MGVGRAGAAVPGAQPAAAVLVCGRREGEPLREWLSMLRPPCADAVVDRIGGSDVPVTAARASALLQRWCIGGSSIIHELGRVGGGGGDKVL